MSIVPREMTVTEAYRLYRSGNLLVNRKYQIKLIWSVDGKEKLIGSILNGYPIPLILLAERPLIHGSGKHEIVYGMQRLNAICGFLENLFAFNGRYFALNEFSHAKKLADDKVFEFEENSDKLDRKECAALLDYQLAVTIYTAMDESDITEVFSRINSGGKHLSNQERGQAGVTTSFIELVWHSAKKSVANRLLFKSIEELQYLLHQFLNEGNLFIKWGRKRKNKSNALIPI